MRTKVYSFKPKGKGYRVYGTKTYHGVRNSSGSSSGYRRSGVMSNLVSDVLARFIVHGIFGAKR